jgi:hypothetical protein
MPISGRVTELRERGFLKVKVGTSAKSPSFEVRFENPSDLLDQHLELGAMVHLLVRVVHQQDKLGRPSDERYFFVEFNPTQEALLNLDYEIHEDLDADGLESDDEPH